MGEILEKILYAMEQCQHIRGFKIDNDTFLSEVYDDTLVLCMANGEHFEITAKKVV